MKAFLLAAGLGSRLRPITDTIPKCLVAVAGRPMLDWWMDLFVRHGVTEVLINTNYLHEQVLEYITAHNLSGAKPKINMVYEAELLGSGGTVQANKEFVSDEELFFICYADNITNMDLTALKIFHKQHDGVLSMALFNAPNPKECGIATIDGNHCIRSFIEKPTRPESNLANAGIYVANKTLFLFLPKDGFCDFGKDVLPRLIDRMYGWETNDYILDVGTIKNYLRANQEWPKINGGL